MGSFDVALVFPASCKTQGNYVCTSRIHSTNLNPMPSIHKTASPIGTKSAGAMFNPATSVLSTKLPSSDLQLQFLAIPAVRRAAPINAMQSSSSSSNSANNAASKTPLMLSEQWQQIQGEKHWEGLLDHPINETLRAEIIRYGEFAQVCYDAFDFNQHSLYCGSCKYNKRVLFEKVDKGGCGYEVTKYLYATSKLDLPKFFKKSERKEEERWSCDSNWIGYVAVCTDEDEIRRIGRRDILIAWRGTVTKTEWIDDLMTTQTPANIELTRSRLLNGPLYNAPSRIQKANAELAESCHNPLANAKPSNASRHDSQLGLNASSIVPSEYQSITNAELHRESQDAGRKNAGAQRQGVSAYIVDEKDVNKDGMRKAEKDVQDNATVPARHDRSAPISNEDLNEVVKVESGFLSLYSSSKANSRFNKLSAGQQMAMEVKRLLEKYEGEEISITITGHSLGAALALLCAYDIAANVALLKNTVSSGVAETIKQGKPTIAASGVRSPAPLASPLITVYSFAGPRVGNRAFKRRVEEVGVRVLRIVNAHDCVPKVPGVLFNEHSPKVWPNTSGYHHVGKELLIDFDFSPHLRRTRDLPSHHNLEAHLHVLDGFHGFTRPFQSVFGRNRVLVNKSSDFLQRESFIPPYWWQESNKGLVKDPLSGQWVLASREDDHLPEIHHSELP